MSRFAAPAAMPTPAVSDMSRTWGTLSSRRRVSGYRVQILRIPHPDWFAEDFQVLLGLLREGKLHPVVAERLPFSEARRAHELLESSAAKGKLVLEP